MTRPALRLVPPVPAWISAPPERSAAGRRIGIALVVGFALGAATVAAFIALTGGRL